MKHIVQGDTRARALFSPRTRKHQTSTSSSNGCCAVLRPFSGTASAGAGCAAAYGRRVLPRTPWRRARPVGECPGREQPARTRAAPARGYVRRVRAGTVRVVAAGRCAPGSERQRVTLPAYLRAGTGAVCAHPSERNGSRPAQRLCRSFRAASVPVLRRGACVGRPAHDAARCVMACSHGGTAPVSGGRPPALITRPPRIDGMDRFYGGCVRRSAGRPSV